MPIPPSAPERQFLTTFTTPLVEDYLIGESVDGQRVQEGIPEYGSAHPDPRKYPDHIFCKAEQIDPEGQNYVFFYVKERLNQDKYNWEHTVSDFGGTKYDTVTRTYVILRSKYDHETPELTSAMPTSESDDSYGPFKNSDGYILISRKQSKISSSNRSLTIAGGDKFTSLFVVVAQVYIKRVWLYEIQYDAEFGRTLHGRDKFFYKSEVIRNEEPYPFELPAPDPPNPTVDKTLPDLMGEPNNPYWGLQADGYVRTAKQLSEGWYLLMEKQVINLGDSGNESELVRDFYTTEQFMWPAVHDYFQVDIYNKKKGGADTVVTPINHREVYRGPCNARVQVYWRSTAFFPEEINPDDPMLAEAMTISTPIFSVSDGPTLHGGENVQIVIGTEDPVYEYTAGIFSWEPTNYVDWPDKIIAADDQRPHRGGYLRQVSTIYKPTGSTDETPPSVIIPPSGGTFDLTFETVTASSIPYNASASYVQDELMSLGTIQAEGGVTVERTNGGYIVVFIEDGNRSPITADVFSITPPSIATIDTVDGTPTTQEIQTIIITPVYPV